MWRAEPAIAKSTGPVHLRAVRRIADRIGGRPYVREPGAMLCRKPSHRPLVRGLLAVPGAAPTCGPCLNAARVHGVRVVDRPPTPPPLVTVRPVAPSGGRALVHLVAGATLRTPIGIRRAGEPMCAPRRARHRSGWMPVPAAPTCSLCRARAMLLGWRPRPPRRGECPEPGCPYVWRFGPSRPCPVHAPPPPPDPWAGLRRLVAAELAAPRPPPVACGDQAGTLAGYGRHHKAGESACVPCEAVHEDLCRAAKLANLVAARSRRAVAAGV